MIRVVWGKKWLRDDFFAAGTMFSKLIFDKQYSRNQLFLLRFIRMGDCDTSSKKVTKRNEWNCFAHIKIMRNVKIHHYWEPQGILQQVSVPGTVQRGLDQVCLHFAGFTSLLIHFSLSKTWKPTFFMFGWQSPAELIKSEVRRIPSDFIVFFMQGIFSVCCLKHGRKIIILLYFPPVLVCKVSHALLTSAHLCQERCGSSSQALTD